MEEVVQLDGFAPLSWCSSICGPSFGSVSSHTTWHFLVFAMWRSTSSTWDFKGQKFGGHLRNGEALATRLK